MSEIESKYTHKLASEDEEGLLLQASELIRVYAQMGLMLEQDPGILKSMASKGNLAVSVCEEEVVATAAYTFAYPDGTVEFGAWAVKPELIKHGIGREVFACLVANKAPERIIAVCNYNSAPIFEKLGAVLLMDDQVHPEVFEPCQSCNCQGKADALAMGRKCVDKIYDLSPVVLNMID